MDSPKEYVIPFECVHPEESSEMGLEFDMTPGVGDVLENFDFNKFPHVGDEFLDSLGFGLSRYKYLALESPQHVRLLRVYRFDRELNDAQTMRLATLLTSRLNHFLCSNFRIANAYRTRRTRIKPTRSSPLAPLST